MSEFSRAKSDFGPHAAFDGAPQILINGDSAHTDIKDPSADMSGVYGYGDPAYDIAAEVADEYSIGPGCTSGDDPAYAYSEFGQEY